MKRLFNPIAVNSYLLAFLFFFLAQSLSAQCNCDSNLLSEKVLKLSKNVEQSSVCKSVNLVDNLSFNSGYISVDPHATIRLYFEIQSSVVPGDLEVKLLDASYNTVNVESKSFADLSEMNQNNNKIYFMQAIPEGVQFIQVLLKSDEPVFVQNLCVSSQNVIKSSF